MCGCGGALWVACPVPASLCRLLPCKDSCKGRYKHAGP